MINYLNDEINSIDCNLSSKYNKNYKVLYFNETGEFMLISRTYLTTTSFNEINKNVTRCGRNILSKQDNNYYIIYNNDYQLLNYSNFKNYGECHNIPILNQETTIITYLVKESTYINDILTTTIPFFETNRVSNSIYIKEVTTKSKEEIFNNITNILEDKKIGQCYEIKGENFSVIIKPTNSTPLPNTTHVEFDECEQKIRKAYNISNSSIITFLQIEINNDNSNALYNQIKYFIYDEQMKELDLSLCEDINTQIYYAIKNNSKLNIPSITNFKEKGIDIFNLKDKFFTDLCYSYSDSNNDMTLEDRIKYLYQNYSLCEAGCTYNSIDLKNMNIACNCKIQVNDNTSSFNMTTLVFAQPQEAGFFDSNIGVIKSYSLVFSLDNKLNNIGFLLFVIIFILYIIFIICLCVNGIQPVKIYLYKEMREKGYISTTNKNSIKITKSGKKIKDKQTMQINKLIKTKKSFAFIEKNKKTNKNSKKKYSAKNKPTNNIIITGINININNNNQYNNRNRNNKNLNTNNQNSMMHSNSKIINNKNSIVSDEFKSNKDFANNFGIIKIDLNDIENYFPQESNQSLHNYTFDEAIKYDQRNILRIVYIYLLSKQIIFKTLFQRSPLELFPLRFILFIFMLSCDLALNALFYFNDNISKKYHYAQNIFLFAFTNNITIIIYSTLLSYFLITLLSKLSNSSNSIRKVFENVENKIKFKKKFKINKTLKQKVNLQIEKILRCFKWKIVFLNIIIMILILAFGYFVTAFCHVFASTQISWLLDSFLSILSRLIIELLFAFLFSKLYQISIRSNCKILYKIEMFIYDFS